ncbi:MAG TPA: carboxypeptidase regulatory-like domain-containing protein [Cyclobacteriaceae bacterium]|nr:carboxypeptidase regulatory-like domain-containing protein [Cyclobacteriaceae bacterium]
MKTTLRSCTVILFALVFLNAAQIVSTQLHITVRDSLGNIVEGASVRLFENEEDYKKESNQAGETLTTDKSGMVKIRNLKSIKYYVLVEKEDMSNIGGGVATEKLVEKKINKVTIIIE